MALDPTVQIALVGAIGIALNCAAVIGVALIQARTLAKNHEEVKAVAANVKVIEVATNSMKDALVKATQVAAESKGRDEERARQEAAKEGTS